MGAPRPTAGLAGGGAPGAWKSPAARTHPHTTRSVTSAPGSRGRPRAPAPPPLPPPSPMSALACPSSAHRCGGGAAAGPAAAAPRAQRACSSKVVPGRRAGRARVSAGMLEPSADSRLWG